MFDVNIFGAMKTEVIAKIFWTFDLEYLTTKIRYSMRPVKQRLQHHTEVLTLKG